MEIIGRLTLVYNKFANTNKCINFKSKEQEDELISQFPHRNFDSNIFMQDGDTILVPLNYEECIKFNYCYFNNKVNNLEQKRYFCYITNYQYVEPNVTRISVAVDTLQTFIFDIDKFRGNIERCHSARRINVSNTETPRYIINPDLYFMEDDVDSYKPVETLKTENPHQTYIVLTYALPTTTNLSGPEYAEVEGFVNPHGVYVDKQTTIGVKEKENNVLETMSITGKINFPTSSSYSFDISGVNALDENIVERFNHSTKEIGDTRLYTIIIPTAPTTAREVDYLPYETFKEMFPLLQDKLVDTFYVDNIDETFKRSVGITIKTGLNFSTSYLYYAVPYARLQTIKKMVNVPTTSQLHPDKWTTTSNDDLLIRKEDQEKKLNLYPYSFVKVTTLGGEMVWKYQENYKVLEEHAGTCYSFVKAFNVLSPNPHIMCSLLFDKENLISYTPNIFNNLVSTSSGYTLDYFVKLNQGYELPSMSIYEEKYTNYLNYRKAIVDANNVMGFAGGIVGGALGVGGSVARGNAELDSINKWYAYDTYYARKRKKEKLKVAYESDIAKANVNKGIGIAGGVAGALKGIGNFVTTALEEQALKKQPMTMLHQGSTSDTFFSCLFDRDGNVHDYVLTKYECIDNIKSVYEQKFYNYGYHIPVDVELTKAEFFSIINNRKYFCYMEWNSLELESFIPTIYVNDIVARLTSGVRFENTSDDTLFPTYTINSNNKETSIPAKPFFVRNY